MGYTCLIFPMSITLTERLGLVEIKRPPPKVHDLEPFHMHIKLSMLAPIMQQVFHLTWPKVTHSKEEAGSFEQNTAQNP